MRISEGIPGKCKCVFVEIYKYEYEYISEGCSKTSVLVNPREKTNVSLSSTYLYIEYDRLTCFVWLQREHNEYQSVTDSNFYNYAQVRRFHSSVDCQPADLHLM